MSRSGHCGIVSNPQRPQPHIFPSVGHARYLCSPHHCSDGLCRDNNTPFNLLNDYSCKKTTAFASTVTALIFISGLVFMLLQFVVLFTSQIYDNTGIYTDMIHVLQRLHPAVRLQWWTYPPAWWTCTSEQWDLQFSAMVFTLRLPKEEGEGIHLSQGETHSPTPRC